MENKSSKFLEKINSFSEEVSLYFSSVLSKKANEEINKDYGLSFDNLYDLLVDFFISDFDLDQLKNNLARMNLASAATSNFINDFLGKFFLAVDEFIPLRVEEEIKSRGGDLLSYQSYIEGLKDILEDAKEDYIVELAESFLEHFDEKEEEGLVISFLSNDLIEFLSSNDVSNLRRLNGSLIYLLINKKDSLNKFIRAFLANQEKISSAFILIKGKREEPTVANWIKHFIENHGSDMPSSITLAKYITSSYVQETLKDEEKNILKQILKIYRNLTFFPDSMANIPMDDWKIIPIDGEEGQAKEAPKTPKKIKTSSVKDNSRMTPKKVLTPEQDFASKELQELQSLLKKYPEKSLEYKALLSEIKKREEKK